MVANFGCGRSGSLSDRARCVVDAFDGTQSLLIRMD